MNKKIMLLILTFAVLIMPIVTASSYNIEQVKVNGIELDGEQVQVEIGTTAEVLVKVKLNDIVNETKEARVTAWLYGTEFDGDIIDSTEPFELKPNDPPIAYIKKLNLNIPTNIEPGTYTLHVRVYDQEDVTENQYTLFIEPSRHMLDLVDYDISPSTSLNAGDTAEIRVRLKNVGKKTEDVKVEVNVPGLGIVRKTWLTLAPNDKVTSEALEVYIPKNTETGDYEVNILITYSDNTEFMELKGTLHVEGIEQPTPNEENAEDEETVVEPSTNEQDEPLPSSSKDLIVSMDSTSQTVETGKDAVFKVTLASFDSKTRLVTFKAAGAQLFADVRIDPSFINLLGGQKAEAYIYVTPNEDAETGKAHNFMLQVTTDDKLIQEIPLTIVVKENTQSQSMNFLNDNTLKMVFVVLVVFLIIIGLLVAFRRIRHDDYPIEPEDGAAYY